MQGAPITYQTSMPWSLVVVSKPPSNPRYGATRAVRGWAQKRSTRDREKRKCSEAAVRALVFQCSGVQVWQGELILLRCRCADIQTDLNIGTVFAHNPAQDCTGTGTRSSQDSGHSCTTLRIAEQVEIGNAGHMMGWSWSCVMYPDHVMSSRQSDID